MLSVVLTAMSVAFTVTGPKLLGDATDVLVKGLLAPSGVNFDSWVGPWARRPLSTWPAPSSAGWWPTSWPAWSNAACPRCGGTSRRRCTS